MTGNLPFMALLAGRFGDAVLNFYNNKYDVKRFRENGNRAGPEAMLPPIKTAATLLTTVSMAALGLGVDIRVVAQAGLRVTAAVTLSLVVLGAISLGLIRLLGVA